MQEKLQTMLDRLWGLPPESQVVDHCSRHRCLLPAEICKKVASEFGLGGVFCQVLWFPPPITTGYITPAIKNGCAVGLMV